MATAFQPSAFQNNAFQIDGTPVTPTTGSGGEPGDKGDQWRKYLLYKKEKRKKKFFKRYAKTATSEVKETIKRYQVLASELSEDQKNILVSAVDPFVIAENQAEIDRRRQAMYAFDKPPPAFRIDFESMLNNSFAKKRFDTLIEKLEKLILEQREQDDELLFIIAAIV